jgi:hypothetical protein
MPEPVCSPQWQHFSRLRTLERCSTRIGLALRQQLQQSGCVCPDGLDTGAEQPPFPPCMAMHNILLGDRCAQRITFNRNYPCNILLSFDPF